MKSLAIRIPEHLPMRHRQVLSLIAKGEMTKGIADRLNLSQGMIDTYRTELSRMTGLHGIANFTKLAIRIGLVELDV